MVKLSWKRSVFCSGNSQKCRIGQTTDDFNTLTEFSVFQIFLEQTKRA